ncbi:MAG: Asp-tRNA(Asn)/Glu-tRNA(Gln) amidotransferase GatCAB subunit B, partial [Anaerolineales bacterium]|nr:Asp-tRNA(Asn)/Glu-tRNA(Gln) amidotransferase GatCAB subunit B [Anaerolineales bacterium]
PEPDLPPLSISDEWIAAVKAMLPELPDAKIQRYQTDYGLSAYDAHVLTDERAVGEWFDTAVLLGSDPKTIANWMINQLFSLINEHKQSIDDIQLTPTGLVELLELVEKQIINNNMARDVLAEMFASGKTAQAIVETKGLAQISDEQAIVDVVTQILDDHAEQVARYLAGQDKLRGWFMGQVMKATRGRANPKLVNQILSRELSRR